MIETVNESRASLEAAQLASLRALLNRLVPHNAFYALRARAAGLDSAVGSLRDFIQRMPFTTKQELLEDQLANPPYGTNLTFPLEHYTRFNQTSATTGAPMRWLDTPESWAWMLDNWEQVYRAAGVDAGDRVYSAFSFGPFLGFWTAFESATRMGCLCIPGGGLSSSARLRAIIDNQATVLCCTPTYAIRLAEVAAEEKIDLNASALKALIVAGEPGGSIPATRACIERHYPGARVYDHHGMTEVGPVSFECPKRRGVLHIIERAFIPEVIDPHSGQPAATGEMGELVLTNLGRTGSPLLRYRTGDLVKPAASNPCECGRFDLALEGGILGRADDMVFIRGVNVYPSAVEDIIRRFPEVAEYKIEIERGQGLAELKLAIEAAPDCADERYLARRLESSLRAAFNLRVPVTSVPRGTLPRFEMKARRWIRH